LCKNESQLPCYSKGAVDGRFRLSINRNSGGLSWYDADSFAGLSTAYWMNKLGYNVTVVEIANGLKKGGTPVNICENTVDIVKRMGLLDQI